MKKKKRNKKIVQISLISIILILIIIAIIINKNKTNKIEMTPEILRSQSYKIADEEDELVYDSNDNLVEAIRFDAFFLKDINGDGGAEKVRGTCNEIGSDANFYMELKVIKEGKLKDASISINANNFYLNTTLIKDNVISENYISSNTKNIKFNEIDNGYEGLFIGTVRSGDYSSNSTRTSAIGNDTSKYCMGNTLTFSGTFEDTNGNTVTFSKTIPFTVDWYGKVDVGINNKVQTKQINNWEELLTDEGMQVKFDVTTTENQNQLIMSKSYISGTIPDLNGYKPISLKIDGTNVTYEYNEETGEFTAQRQAELNEQGVVIKNAYSSISSSYIKNNVFNVTIIYPKEAYDSLGDETSKNFELKIPIVARNEGYNNPNEQDGFSNPYVSEDEKSIITISYENYSGEDYKFYINVGKYEASPFNTYIHSKQKPLNIYNGISLEEKDDTYIVTWEAHTGEYSTADGIIMKETPDSKTEKYSDYFVNTSNENISMESLTTNKGIYFSGLTNTFGNDGWVKIYNDETNELIETFTSDIWNVFSETNPYIYENEVKHIRIETSSVVASSNFYVYNIKELDDTYITENFSRDEFDELAYIYSNLSGYMVNTDFSETLTNKAMYDEPTSIANISIKDNTITTKSTAENQKITITTDTSKYNEQLWKNGIFLVKLPAEIISVEINSININNEKVKISAYDLYEENGNYYLKILTENETEETFSITVDYDITPDPRIPKTQGKIEFYAINENASDYYYSNSDIYDLDGDLNTEEKVNYKTVTLTMEPGNSLNTTQFGSNYGDEDNISIAPRVAKMDKNQRTATITISVLNNYTFDVQDIKIQGVIPFEGNDYLMTENDLGSTYSTQMVAGGIEAVTEGIEDYVSIYYSSEENPTNDIDLKSNGWTLAENIKDWSKVKTYIIVLDNEYKLLNRDSLEFSYDIAIPEGIDYNQVSYSAHVIYFSLLTNEGLYATSTAPEKLGFMIAKQYNLEIVKYQEETEKTIQGVTFTLKEDGQDTSTIKVTGADGKTKFSGLFAERYYTLKEEKTTDDYVLNSEEIRFYTYTEINADGTESLYVVHVNEDGSYSKLSEKYSSIFEDTVFAPNEEKNEDYKIQLKINNEVKVKLEIHKTDKESGQPIENVKYTLTGGDKNEEILTTDKQGNILVSGLLLDQEYVLTETKATGYYIAQEPIKFKIINENGEFKFAYYTDNNNITVSNLIEVQDEIPRIKLELQNEKIPTFGIQLTKYAKNEKVENDEGEQVDKVLYRAQYIIYGEGISENGQIYTTDENGIITINGLYEYVAGKYITGEYTLTEIYAPEGYSVNTTSLKFKAYRENGTLKMDILEGEDVIRLIETTDSDGNIVESNKDLNITNASSNYPVIEIGVEDNPIFSIFKFSKDGTTDTKIPIPGTKFVITDLSGDYVKDADGNTVGQWDETLQKYVVTTDENGQITANLTEGLYKAIEVYAGEKYELSTNEADRTYYFGIGKSQGATFDWTNTINGQGWDYINSIDATKDGGVIGVGEFSEFSDTIVTGAIDGVDLNDDGQIDKVSQGLLDGIIVNYDIDGNLKWSKTLGGKDEDGLNKVIQTSDGGFAAVGYVTSSVVNYDGKPIKELSKTSDNENLGNKDSILIKIDSDGNYEWGIRFGGSLDDEIKAITETNNKQFVLAGNFYSSTLNFYEYDGENVSDIKSSFDNLNIGKSNEYQSGMSGFIVAYSENGKYEWSQRIGGEYDVGISDVKDTDDGVAVAVNHIGNIYFDTNKTSSVEGSSQSYTNATIVKYNLDGTYSWNYRIYPNSSKGNVAISAIDTDFENNIIFAINYTEQTLCGSKNGENATEIYKADYNELLGFFNVIKLSKDGIVKESLFTSSLIGNVDVDDVVIINISDIDSTLDGGILIGIFQSSNGYNQSVMVKLNSINFYDIVYESVISEPTQTGVETYSENIIKSVLETTNGKLVFGGYSNLKILVIASMFYDDSSEPSFYTLSNNGNTIGFISSGFSDGSIVIPQTQNLQVENKLKELKITTEVIKHDESGTQVAGGNINGEVELHEVETVTYGKNSTKEIKITPDAGYVVSYIKINGTEYTNYVTNSDGTVTLPIFENVTENKNITVEFSNTISSVEVNHYLWNENGATTEKVADTENYTGKIGETYNTLPATDIDYDIITNAEYYGANLPADKNGEDFYIPDNYSGTFETGNKQVVNYYYKEKTYTLTVHHYIAGTNEQVPLKGSTNGEKVPDEITENLNKNFEYNTEQASEDLIDYSIYKLVETPENATGTISENTEVIYYYQIITVNLGFTKVAEEDHSVALEGTEFALYKLNDENSAEKDELIDVKDVASCWTLVNTYITPDTGKVNLEDLPINSEYRLVETKASQGRLVSNGQWKIEFMCGQYNEQDPSIITVNGIKLKITAIENPPGFIQNQENGELLLPNRAYYQFPTSGSIGSKTIYQIGIAIITTGIIILLIWKKFLIKNK